MVGLKTKSSAKDAIQSKKQFDADLSQKPSRAPDDDHDLHHQIGNQASMRLSDGTILQPKLTVSQPDDPLEKEADRIADEVMRMPDLLHKEDDSSPIKGMDTKIHSFGRGHPIPKHELDFFESRFNQDFSEVRLHNNGHANKFAESLNAKALTAGRNIVFGPGQYQLESVKGKKLIAHELTHVVQQRASSFGDFNSNIKSVNKLSNNIQRKIVDQNKNEIGVNVIDDDDPRKAKAEFSWHPKTSNRYKREAEMIVKALLMTPLGIIALKEWIRVQTPVQLNLVKRRLRKRDAQPEENPFIHGLTKPRKNDPTEGKEFYEKLVKVKVSTARLPNDRYENLKGNQLINAIAVHEQIHIDPDQKHTELAAIKAELESLIQFDIIYPDMAGQWLTESFKKYLGETYNDVVNKTIGYLVDKKYLPEEQRDKMIDLYINHKKN